jgi:hypothetical protein
MDHNDYDYSFMNEDDVILVKDGIQAVRQIGEQAWSALRSHCGPYMYDRSPICDQVLSHMELKDNHSGFSFAWTMNQLDFIAKHGWESYVDSYKRNQRNSST